MVNDTESPKVRVGRSITPFIGLTVSVMLIALAMIIPAASGWMVFANSLPPLHAEFLPRLGWGTIPAIVIGVLGIRFAIDLAAGLRWRLLLIATFLGSLAWLVSLALVDGPSGLGAILDTRHEYLPTARSITDVGATLREYIDRIPAGSVGQWPIHIAGHPPGAVLFFWFLGQVGLESWLGAGLVVIVMGATVPVAVAVTLRQLDAEGAARRAVPFLALGPAALWMAVSADGMFTAFAAWGFCCLAIAATSTRPSMVAAWALTAGLLLGYCVMLSYGLVLLGVIAVGILLIARRWQPLPWAVGSAILVVLAFALAGFVWWDAFPVLVDRYWDGIASRRPFEYWVWGNLAALSFSAGPMVGVAVAVALAKIGAWRDAVPNLRVVVILTVSAVVTVLLADFSALSKAEVERIWLPFVPWLLVGTALLPERWRRAGLALQVVFALVVQHLIFTRW